MAKYKFDDIAFNSISKKKPVDEDKQTYLGLEHLDGSNLQVTRFGADVAPIGEKLLMKKGDVLFGKRRAYQKKVAIAPFDGIFSAHGMVLRPKEEVAHKDFFPFFISSDYFLDEAIRISVGSLSPTINWKDLKELEFELPDMDEQERFAKILWSAEELKIKIQTTINHTEILLDAINTDVYENQSHPFIKLHDICTYVRGLTYKSKDESAEQTDYIVLRSNNIDKTNHLLNLSNLRYVTHVKNDNAKFEKDDIFVCSANGSPEHIGKFTIIDYDIDAYFGGFMGVLRCNKSLILPQFLFYSLHSKKYSKYIHQVIAGSNIINLKGTDFLNFGIRLPNIEKQYEVINLCKKVSQSRLKLLDEYAELIELNKHILRKDSHV